MPSAEIQAFRDWLPGELVYSARKAGYDKKIERSRLLLEDGRSIVSFLSKEWDNHSLLATLGNHHVDHHGMSAQLQLAKLAAGLFDKVGLGVWLLSGDVAAEDTFIDAAQQAGEYVLGQRPWHVQRRHAVRELAGRPFVDTPLHDEVVQMSRGIAVAASIHDGLAQDGLSVADRTHQIEDLRSQVADFSKHAMYAGGITVKYYADYARQNLTPDEFWLAPSQSEEHS